MRKWCLKIDAIRRREFSSEFCRCGTILLLLTHLLLNSGRKRVFHIDGEDESDDFLSFLKIPGFNSWEIAPTATCGYVHAVTKLPGIDMWRMKRVVWDKGVGIPALQLSGHCIHFFYWGLKELLELWLSWGRHRRLSKAWEQLDTNRATRPVPFRLDSWARRKEERQKYAGSMDWMI